MTLLVLCIDRDNDFGTKAGIQSPIVGREACVKAAQALALADPEDSDTNSLFGAIKVFDEFLAKGREVEIVTICGSQRVGPHSDSLIAEQLDEVIAKLRVDRAIFVTDGAEDEFILPLVTSRVRVEGVQRIIVRQHKDIEGTYYIIKRAFEDDKLQRGILMPVSLALIVYGAFAWYGRPDQGLGAIAALVGMYFIAKIMELGATLRGLWQDLVTGLKTSRVTLFTSVIAGVLVVSGAVNALQQVPQDPNLLAYTLAFAGFMLWWFVGAALVHLAGRAVDHYLRDPAEVWDLWLMPFSLVALGLLGSAILAATSRAIAGEPFTFTGPEAVAMALGVVVAFVGAGSNAYIQNQLEKRRRPGTRDADAEPARAP